MLFATTTDSPDVLPAEPGDEVAAETASMLETIVQALPRIGVAIAIVVVAWLVGAGLRRLLRSRLTKARGESYGRVFSKLAYALVLTAGVLLAVTVIFPTVKPGDLIAGLGVFSIAIGFAFQDILSNLLAGILLLVRQPFEVGDQIEVSGWTGTVEGITIRETQLKTFGGEQIIVPNADVYQQVLRVQTAYGPKRTVLAIGLDDHEDQDRATDVLLRAVQGIEGVEDEPAPQVYFTGYGDSTTNLDLRYWTQPEQATVRATQDRVVRSISAALKDNGIDMPSPIRELDARESMKAALSDGTGSDG